MKVIFDCKQCGKSLEIDEAYSTHKVACCFCENTVTVPAISRTQVDKFLIVGKWILFGVGCALALMLAIKVVLVSADFLGLDFNSGLVNTHSITFSSH